MVVVVVDNLYVRWIPVFLCGGNKITVDSALSTLEF